MMYYNLQPQNPLYMIKGEIVQQILKYLNQFSQKGPMKKWFDSLPP